ncbi:MAG: hypothetical protein IID43_05160 [Planctomycetes bacterium]|nr:hypothetical protein [Planctomycetota bacterium]
MALDSDELDRLSDDIYRQRRLTASTYCGNCGYNLVSLPYVYTCPECGQEYNARPLRMSGIFLPYANEFPVGDVAGALLCCLFTLLLAYPALNPVNPDRLWIAGFFFVIAFLFGIKGYLRLSRFLKAQSIARHIAKEEGEEF